LIRALRPPDRQVMLLYLEDQDAATIAEITGLSAGNVATKVHRIKQVLTRRFHGRGADHE
jgi:RNA polymerase sigma-70 factor (ECF subfamily)